jgi:hypothetical protein
VADTKISATGTVDGAFVASRSVLSGDTPDVTLPRPPHLIPLASEGRAP